VRARRASNEALEAEQTAWLPRHLLMIDESGRDRVREPAEGPELGGAQSQALDCVEDILQERAVLIATSSRPFVRLHAGELQNSKDWRAPMRAPAALLGSSGSESELFRSLR